jgi:hypothetical protein
MTAEEVGEGSNRVTYITYKSAVEIILKNTDYHLNCL